MNRQRLLAAIRLQMEQEKKSGVLYWCDSGLSEALREANRPVPVIRQPRQTKAPAAAKAPIPAMALSAEAGKNPTRRFARPPARLDSKGPSKGPTGAGSGAKVVRPNWGVPPKATGREKDWEKSLAAIEQEVTGCTACTLAEGRQKTVFGAGDATVPLVFVGEAPGAEEDRQGIPFVGRAGNLLTKIIEAMGLKREQVYICNVLKCRPPGNRDPQPDEVATCSPFLDRQLALLKPKVICTLGRHSTMRLTGQAAAMKSLHGQIFEYRGFQVIPTYHPAALLRNPSLKALVWEDVQKVRALLDAEQGA